LSEIRFWLWWEGYEIPISAIRATIKRLLSPRQDNRGLGQEQRRPRDPLEAAENAAGNLLARPRSSSHVVRQLRRHLGNDEDAFTALVALLLPVFGGKPVWKGAELALELGETEPQELVLKGLDLQRAATDRVGDVGPWLPEGKEAIPLAISALREAGFFKLESLHGLVNTLTVEELEQARAGARSFGRDLPVVAEARAVRFGRGAFGLGAFRSLAVKGPGVARMLAGLVVLGGASQRLLGPGPLQVVGDAIRGEASKARPFIAIAHAFPQYKRYLAEGGERKLAALPAEKRRQIADDIDAYLAARPDVRVALEGTA
jgi:hypothetical protein